MTEFILIYILIGVLFAAATCWDEICNVFGRWEPNSVNPLSKDEWQEFATLMLICLFGWGVLLIIAIIGSIKGIWRK